MLLSDADGPGSPAAIPSPQPEEDRMRLSGLMSPCTTWFTCR